MLLLWMIYEIIKSIREKEYLDILTTIGGALFLCGHIALPVVLLSQLGLVGLLIGIAIVVGCYISRNNVVIHRVLLTPVIITGGLLFSILTRDAFYLFM